MSSACLAGQSSSTSTSTAAAAGEPERLLQGLQQRSVHSPNCVWDGKAEHFVLQEVTRLRAAEALRTWQELGMATADVAA